MAHEVLITDRARQRHQLVLFDFDGTLCLGDDPVLTYAQCVDDVLAERGVPGFSVRQAVQRGLDVGTLNVPEIRLDDKSYPADIAGKTDMALWPLQDGYQLVQLLGLQAGLDSTDTHAAFRASRTQLLTQGLASSDVHAPDAAVDVLQQLRNHAGLVLITNSPAENFETWLTQLGLQDQFDLIINSAKKPNGMPTAVQQARRNLNPNDETPMSSVISIGDIWGNDLAYVHDQGGHTILIDRFSTGLGTPDHRVAGAATALQLLNDQLATRR